MKKEIKILTAAAALSCCLAFPALADMNRSEYKEEKTVIHTEMKSINDENAVMRAENKAVADKYKAIQKNKKETGALSIDKYDWQQAKELRKEISEIRKSMNDKTIKELKAQARAAAKEKDFDTAVSYLNQALDISKSRQDSQEQINNIWKQIDELIS